MHGQPLVDISHSMSFSFNQLKTSTEKSNRESFHESDMIESQNLNLKMISSNIRLLEEISKNQVNMILKQGIRTIGGRAPINDRKVDIRK